MPSPPALPTHCESFEGVLASCWSWMERGVQDRRCAAHHPTFASVRADGRPTCRTVILRECLRPSRILGFHTDRRSRKWQEIEQTSAGALHVYLPQQKVQIRFVGATERIDDIEENRSRWLNMHANSRRCYQSLQPPGASLESPLQVLPESEDTLAGFENFGWVRLHVEELEWLYLSSSGHQRAIFTWSADGNLHAAWWAP